MYAASKAVEKKKKGKYSEKNTRLGVKRILF